MDDAEYHSPNDFKRRRGRPPGQMTPARARVLSFWTEHKPKKLTEVAVACTGGSRNVARRILKDLAGLGHINPSDLVFPRGTGARKPSKPKKLPRIPLSEEEKKARAKEAAKRWYEANQRAISDRRKAKYDAGLINQKKPSREKAMQYAATWREKNPDKVAAMRKAAKARRRARERNAEGSFTPKEIERLFERQKGKCSLCRTSIKSGYQPDHIMPLALGGSNFIRNIQLLCAPCNQRKRDKHPADFSREIGLLI